MGPVIRRLLRFVGGLLGSSLVAAEGRAGCFVVPLGINGRTPKRCGPSQSQPDRRPFVAAPARRVKQSGALTPLRVFLLVEGARSFLIICRAGTRKTATTYRKIGNVVRTGSALVSGLPDPVLGPRRFAQPFCRYGYKAM
jgi:hypothetical protein